MFSGRMPLRWGGHVCIAIAVMLTGSCGLKDTVDYFSQEPDAEAVRQAITTGSLLGYAVSAAMGAVDGAGQGPARVIAGVASFPGSGLIAVESDVAQGLPAGVVSGKTIYVAGFWPDSQTAILTVTCADGSLAHGGIAFTNVATFPATRTDSGWVLTFASEDVNAGTSDTALTMTMTEQQVAIELNRLASRPSIDSSISVDQDAWVIEVDDAGTPALLADDRYSIVGAGQHVGLGFAGEQLAEGELLQIVMVECALSAQCGRNPSKGWGVVRKYSAPRSGGGERTQFGTSVWQFHGRCDGRADILAGTGTYLGFSGRTVELNLP